MEINIKINNDELKELLVLHSKPSYREPEYDLSPYACFFDEDSKVFKPYWDAEDVKFFLHMQQNYFNDLLRCRGRLYLSEVYNMLGLPVTKTSKKVGWIYEEKNPNGDNYVDIGLYDLRNRHFINGCGKSVLLDFNVDGYILDRIR